MKLKRFSVSLTGTGDPEIINLFEWGIEGKHYTMKDGKPARTSDQEELYSLEVNPIMQIDTYFGRPEFMPMKGE